MTGIGRCDRSTTLRAGLGRPCAALGLLVATGCRGEAPAVGPDGVPTPGSASAAAAPASGAAPSGAPWFEESALRSGLDFTYHSGHAERYLMPEIMGGGGALLDMDDDGDLDAYVVQGGPVLAEPSARPTDRLFRNRGDGTFEDVTAASGVDGRGYGNGVASGDYDDDGRVDLYVTNLGPNSLLHNEGGGRFRPVPDAGGAAGDDWSASAAFVDYDRDGDLDLFVVNYLYWSTANERRCTGFSSEADYCSPNSYGTPAQDRLYRNNGDGSFTDVTLEAGLTTAFGNGLGVAPGDFNGDGWPDVAVANDGTPNQLWLNNGDGTFVDEAPLVGVAIDETGVAKAGMGIAAADVDDDLDLDLLIVNLDGETDSLFRNEGGTFASATAAARLANVSRTLTRFGVGFVDFDNDGRLDLYEACGRVRLPAHPARGADPYAEPNLLLRGTAEGTYEEVLPRGGAASPLTATSRAAVFGDVDNDGGVDVLVVNRDGPLYLLRNRAGRAGHWLLLAVREASGRPALGARLTVELGGRTLSREVQSAYSYQAANDPRVHIGLGAAERVEAVTVRWVDGQEEHFGAIDPVDRVVELRRGADGGRGAGDA